MSASHVTTEASLQALRAAFSHHVATVRAAARLLGIPPALLDEVAVQAFVMAHGRGEDLSAPEPARARMTALTRRVAEWYREELPPGAGDAPLGITGGSALSTFLAGLSDQAREIFVLSEIGGLKVPEISAELGISFDAARAAVVATVRDFAAAAAAGGAEEVLHDLIAAMRPEPAELELQTAALLTRLNPQAAPPPPAPPPEPPRAQWAVPSILRGTGLVEEPEGTGPPEQVARPTVITGGPGGRLPPPPVVGPPAQDPKATIITGGPGGRLPPPPVAGPPAQDPKATVITGGPGGRLPPPPVAGSPVQDPKATVITGGPGGRLPPPPVAGPLARGTGAPGQVGVPPLAGGGAVVPPGQVASGPSVGAPGSFAAPGQVASGTGPQGQVAPGGVLAPGAFLPPGQRMPGAFAPPPGAPGFAAPGQVAAGAGPQGQVGPAPGFAAPGQVAAGAWPQGQVGPGGAFVPPQGPSAVPGAGVPGQAGGSFAAVPGQGAPGTGPWGQGPPVLAPDPAVASARPEAAPGGVGPGMPPIGAMAPETGPWGQAGAVAAGVGPAGAFGGAPVGQALPAAPEAPVAGSVTPGGFGTGPGGQVPAAPVAPGGFGASPAAPAMQALPGGFAAGPGGQVHPAQVVPGGFGAGPEGQVPPVAAAPAGPWGQAGGAFAPVQMPPGTGPMGQVQAGRTGPRSIVAELDVPDRDLDERPPRLVNRPTALIVVGLLVLGVAGGGGYWAWKSTQVEPEPPPPVEVAPEEEPPPPPPPEEEPPPLGPELPPTPAPTAPTAKKTDKPPRGETSKSGTKGDDGGGKSGGGTRPSGGGGGSKPEPEDPYAKRREKANEADPGRVLVELEYLSAIDKALKAGNWAQALAYIDQHDKELPGGQLVDKFDERRIRALCGMGRAAEAKTKVDQILAKRPTSKVKQALAESCK